MVVGGGPAGSTVARMLSKELDVLLVEEHRCPGRPVQCAGLVTPRGIPPSARKSIIGRVRGARIHSPLGFTLALEAKETRACVIDRGAFDQALFDEAVSAGAATLTDAKVTSVRDGGDAVDAVVSRQGAEETVQAAVAIGAEGFKSICRKAAGLPPAKHMLTGIQVDLAGLKSDPDSVDIYIGAKVAPGFFAWAIPAGDVVRVGLCTWRSEHTPSIYLKSLLRRQEFAGGRKVGSSSGKIPLGSGRSAQAGRIMLVGDAACHAKPLSGGGVFMGVRGAELCAQSVLSFKETGKPSSLAGYDGLWREGFGRELSRAFRLRKIFLTLTDKKMDKALRMFDDPSVKRFIEENADIDYPASLSSSVLKLAPKLAQFSPQLIESLF